MRKYKLKTENYYFALVEFEYDGHPSDFYGIEEQYDSGQLYEKLEYIGAKNIVIYSKEDLGDGFTLFYES